MPSASCSIVIVFLHNKLIRCQMNPCVFTGLSRDRKTVDMTHDKKVKTLYNTAFYWDLENHHRTVLFLLYTASAEKIGIT